MNKQLHLETNLGSAIIELLDNDFVYFWLDHFLKLQQNYKFTGHSVYWPYCKMHGSHSEALAIIQKLVNTIENINQLEYLKPIPETDVEQQLTKLDVTSQQCLNRLHRYLVVATELRDRWITSSPPIFKIPLDDTEFMYLLNLANQTIHALEEYIHTPNKISCNEQIKYNEFSVNGSKYTDVNIYEDDIDIEIPVSMQKHLQLSGFDVWIKKDILGKDFITAFADHDNPGEFDIRPPPMISGGFLVDIDKNNRQQFFNSPKFIEWLGTTPTNYHGSYALGNVIAGKQHILNCTDILSAKVD